MYFKRIPGLTLSECNLSEEKWINVIIQILILLMRLQENSISHGDLSLTNFILKPDESDTKFLSVELHQ